MVWGFIIKLNSFPATLSGGQMQRVAIARALTNTPAVIFADEPTGDLDSETGKQVMDLLKKFHEETKTTIIVITHAKDVADYAERRIIIEDGVIVPNQWIDKDFNAISHVQKSLKSPFFSRVLFDINLAFCFLLNHDAKPIIMVAEAATPSAIHNPFVDR